MAIGIDVFDDQIFVADFYGNRLLIYDFDRNLLSTLMGDFDKPTDVLVAKTTLLVPNYGENTISVAGIK